MTEFVKRTMRLDFLFYHSATKRRPSYLPQTMKKKFVSGNHVRQPASSRRLLLSIADIWEIDNALNVPRQSSSRIPHSLMSYCRASRLKLKLALSSNVCSKPFHTKTKIGRVLLLIESDLTYTIRWLLFLRHRFAALMNHVLHTISDTIHAIYSSRVVSLFHIWSRCGVAKQEKLENAPFSKRPLLDT